MSPPLSSLPSSSKKRKIYTNNDALSHIRQFETQLASAVSSNSSLNPLADLLDLALNAQDAGHLCKAIYALYRVFILLISNGTITRHPSGDDEKAVHLWLVEKLNTYVELLAGLLQDEDAALRTSALQILLSLQKHLSKSATVHSPPADQSQPQFHISHFRKIVNALLSCPSSPRKLSLAKKHKVERGVKQQRIIAPDVRDAFIQTCLDVYDDIRWFFLREAGNILSHRTAQDNSHIPENVLSLLEGLTTFPTLPSELNAWWVEELGARPAPVKGSPLDANAQDDEEEMSFDDKDDWRAFFDQDHSLPDSTKSKAPSVRLHKLTLHQSLHSLPSHRAVFTRAWLGLLSSLSARATESKAYSLRVLNILHRGVIPHLTRPILIMDWVGSCVDYGGTVGLLALNALFTLMKEYNLDYPSFYTRLYAFLDRDVLHLKHRARFFRLTELFLSSTHLPAALVAAFVKRLSRLSLNAPPAAVVMIIPFTYNLFKRHPALMHMIHRVNEVDENGDDPFQMHESNPVLSNAIESSIWELYTHKQHYHAVASTLASVFEEAFTRPAYAMEDFLDHTYGTLFDTEAQRRIRKEPVVDLELRPNGAADVVADMWAF